MQPYGGFDHNAQALKIVTSLERHYAEFDGLNLTWECLEGIAKHNGPVPQPWPFALSEYTARHDLELHTHASAEAQVAALSDDIAYNNHDLHDGLRAGLFTDDDICALPIVGDAYAQVDAAYPGLAPKRRRHEALRRVFGVMVADVIKTSRALLEGITSADQVRSNGAPVVQFSAGLWADLKVIRAFLFKQMYRAPEVVEMRKRVTRVVEGLFPLYMARPELLPKEWAEDVAAATQDVQRARLVADYIAGMTDRFALAQAEAHLEL